MATIKDIAKASRVCPATVSNVLNNSRPVHPRTRERVLEAARNARYRPNAVARALVGKQMNTLGIVYLHRADDANLDPYFVAMLDGVLAEARRHRQNVTLCTSGSWDDDAMLLPSLCDSRCDGIILVVPPEGDIIGPGLESAGVPYVIIGSQTLNPATPSVDVDNEQGAAAIVQHLIDQGHQRIALLVPELDKKMSYVSERCAGYRRALAANGIAFDSSLVKAHAFGHMANRSAVEALMAYPRARRPTALFSTFDLGAIDALYILREMGLRVPDDISVAGFDDIAAAATSAPPLTTIRQPFREIGARATAKLLMQIGRAGDAAGRDILPTQLIMRESVAPPPIS